MRVRIRALKARANRAPLFFSDLPFEHGIVARLGPLHSLGLHFIEAHPRQVVGILNLNERQEYTEKIRGWVTGHPPVHPSPKTLGAFYI